jgi:hypothetical protein
MYNPGTQVQIPTDANLGSYYLFKKTHCGVSPTAFLSKKSFPPPSRRVALGFPLGLAGWAFLGMVHLAQVAKTLPLRPTQGSVEWAHFGPTQEPSRTLRYNTDKLQNFSRI